MSNHQNLLLCSCNSTDHQMVIYRTTDPLLGPECYVHMHLAPRPFWYRVKYAIKYIFGYRCRYGAWDEFYLDSSHTEKLLEVVEHLTSSDAKLI